MADLLDEGFVCQVCDGTQYNTLYQSNTLELGNIVRCIDCQFVTVYPMPAMDFIAKSYQGLYQGREAFDRKDPEKMQQVSGTFRAYLKRLNANGQKPKTFLDVGGGLGYFSASAQAAGLKATLIDLDEESLKFAHEVLGVENVAQGTLESFAEQASEKFDLILFRHVIEHLTDPSTIVSAIASLLTPDGIAIIETPNNNSQEAFLHPKLKQNFIRELRKNYRNVNAKNIVKKRAYAMRPPIHLNAFSMSTLTKLAEKCGLEVVDQFTYKLGDKDYWPNFNPPTIKRVLKNMVKLRVKASLKELRNYLSFVLGRELLSRNNYSGLHIKVSLKK